MRAETVRTFDDRFCFPAPYLIPNISEQLSKVMIKLDV
jgi:hypothetical protein